MVIESPFADCFPLNRAYLAACIRDLFGWRANARLFETILDIASGMLRQALAELDHAHRMVQEASSAHAALVSADASLQMREEFLRDPINSKDS